LIADQSARDESDRSDGSTDASVTCSGANNRTVPAPAPVPKSSSRKKEFERKIALEPLTPLPVEVFPAARSSFISDTLAIAHWSSRIRWWRVADESEERTRRALPNRQRWKSVGERA